MLMTLTLLSLVSWLHYGASIFRTCIPNSQFLVNERWCVCDATGQWNDDKCEASRRHICNPGQIIWEGCSQCICQEDGQMMCTTMCGDEATSKPSQIHKTIDVKRMWCIPFVSYYVNCSLCVCPASGKMSVARCASDATCPFRESTDYLEAVKNNVCIPKVMYLFPCLYCMCSDEGLFIISKCVETCQKDMADIAAQRCMPKKFYRKDCNICFCPDIGVKNDKLCTKSVCSHKVKFNSLAVLRDKSRKCQRQTFIGPICVYCECSDDDTINENACIESDCITIGKDTYNFDKNTCSSGEMVPKCINCLCLHNGYTDSKYCTNDCTYKKKLSIIEIAIKDSFNHHHVIDRKSIKILDNDNMCEPKSLYQKHGKYCLCPDNGHTDLILCTPVIEERHIHREKTKISIKRPSHNIDFSARCNPNTFVEFDCNTCYCLKSGKIDPKWCTYDDCEYKKITLERQKSDRIEPTPTDGACTPGSVSKENCNFCVCPENGQLQNRACTKNICAGAQNKVSHGLSCEPLSYYNVDCNICYCPKSGFKNVGKCTKSTCEKNFLRSEVCVPGKLFSEECNVCVCPPNGEKSDRVCTNNTCDESDTPWKKIYLLSQSLFSYQKVGVTTRNLELCFPGEEFEVGCKVCLCPDMGLRVYATCTQMLCDEERNTKEVTVPLHQQPAGGMERKTRRSSSEEIKDSSEGCVTFNITSSAERQTCTPGSMYIIRCKQCICPYMGNTDQFCRPLPENFYCEQAFPNINYVAMGRINSYQVNGTSLGLPSKANKTYTDIPIKSPHSHTAWACETAGRVMDNCFICDCTDNVIIEEHCFKNEDASCANTEPTFLKIKLPER